MAIDKEFIKKVMAGKVRWEKDDSVSEMIAVNVKLKFDEMGASLEVYDLDQCMVKKCAPLEILNGDSMEIGQFYFKLKVR